MKISEADERALMKLRAKARGLGANTWVDFCDLALDGDREAFLACKRVIETKDDGMLLCRKSQSLGKTPERK